MTAVRVSQAARPIVELGVEERGVGVLGRVLVEQPVHRSEQLFRLLHSGGALAAQVGLKVGHQQRRRNALAGDVAKHQAEPRLAEIEKVVVVAADLSRLNAGAGVLQGLQFGQSLWKQPRLHLPGNLQLVSSPPLRIPPFGGGLALRLHRAADFVETDQRKRILIEVFETGEGATPRRRVVVSGCGRGSRRFIGDAPQSRRAAELDAAAAPFAVRRRQVFGHEDHLGRAADQLGLERMRRRLDEGEHGRPVRRRNCHQPLT